jgi:hypothetical protein
MGYTALPVSFQQEFIIFKLFVKDKFFGLRARSSMKASNVDGNEPSGLPTGNDPLGAIVTFDLKAESTQLG